MDKTNNKTTDRSVKKSVKPKPKVINSVEKRKMSRNRDKKIEKSKKQKYSANSSGAVLNEWKSSARNGLNSVRNTFDNLSHRLKLSSISSQHLTNNTNDCRNYGQLNGNTTPIQLYSPFGFESPSPRVDRTHLKRSCCRQMFFSPTAKIREDVLYLNNGIKELNLLSEDIENRVSPLNSKQSLNHFSSVSLI